MARVGDAWGVQGTLTPRLGVQGSGLGGPGVMAAGGGEMKRGVSARGGGETPLLHGAGPDEGPGAVCRAIAPYAGAADRRRSRQADGHRIEAGPTAALTVPALAHTPATSPPQSPEIHPPAPTNHTPSSLSPTTASYPISEAVTPGGVDGARGESGGGGGGGGGGRDAGALASRTESEGGTPTSTALVLAGGAGKHPGSGRELVKGGREQGRGSRGRREGLAEEDVQRQREEVERREREREQVVPVRGGHERRAAALAGGRTRDGQGQGGGGGGGQIWGKAEEEEEDWEGWVDGQELGEEEREEKKRILKQINQGAKDLRRWIRYYFFCRRIRYYFLQVDPLLSRERLRFKGCGLGVYMYIYRLLELNMLCDCVTRGCGDV